MGKGQADRNSSVVVGATDDDVPVIVPSEAVAAELAGQRDAVGNGGTREPVSQPPQIVGSAAMTKKEKKRLKDQARGKGEEERECSVM